MIKDLIFKILSNTKIKNFIVYGFGQAVNLISPLLVIPYIVSVCGEEGLGKTGVGFSFALIAIVLVDYGSYINGTKEISLNNSDITLLEEKFTTIYLSKLILLIGVLALSTLVIPTVPFFKADKIQLLLSLTIVVGQFVNPIWFFQGIQNFKWITIINVVSKVFYVVAVFVFVKEPDDYNYVNFFLGSGLLLASLLGFFWICKSYSFSLKKSALPKAINLIKSEFFLTVSQLFFSIYQYAPIIMISYLCGSFVAGQYRIVDQIVMIFRTYLQMFFNFIYADICLKIYNDVAQGISYWKKLNGLNYLFIVVILIGFYFFTNQILTFFKVNNNDQIELGSNFKIGLLIPVFMGVSFAFKQLMFSFDKNKAYINITILTTILSAILLYVFLQTIGLKGAFISIIIIEIIIIIAYILVLRTSFVNPFRK